MVLEDEDNMLSRMWVSVYALTQCRISNDTNSILKACNLYIRRHREPEPHQLNVTEFT